MVVVVQFALSLSFLVLIHVLFLTYIPVTFQNIPLNIPFHQYSSLEKKNQNVYPKVNSFDFKMPWYFMGL